MENLRYRSKQEAKLDDSITTLSLVKAAILYTADIWRTLKPNLAVQHEDT